MASTPTPPQPQPKLLPIKAAARKLPVKRKTPDLPSTQFSTPSPNPICPSPVPNQIPKIEIPDEENDIINGEEDLEVAAEDDLKPPPFKFHRIWPESDEIRFLQGLLECSTDGFIFPRDLPLFYDRFSQSMPQPYTRSQLSEKLRRLRKKFRVISTRISRGLDPSLLASHDRALFDLSKQLWHPSYASSSPFQSNKRKPSTSNVSVRVSFSPTPSACLPPPPVPPPVQTNINDADVIEEDTELNLENNLGSGQDEEPYLPVGDDGGFRGGGGLGRFAAKTVLDVFDRSLKDVRMTLVSRELLYPDQTSTSTSTPAESSKQGRSVDFEKRWRQQRAAELDVMARRLRLVLENAINER
ncbi:probable transcription factor At5g28040 [Macadamia integrifolia]|uniref:probable transcription factor At5g28040 n=1 Tax=Macadamia integrifolia TaxID=60698 RepID=UPI001C4E37D1|nr:probable transcription factor At5g28040 [Macadamia integrifolia]